jgi:hypothetical protein
MIVIGSLQRLVKLCYYVNQNTGLFYQRKPGCQFSIVVQNRPKHLRNAVNNASVQRTTRASLLVTDEEGQK